MFPFFREHFPSAAGSTTSVVFAVGAAVASNPWLSMLGIVGAFASPILVQIIRNIHDAEMAKLRTQNAEMLDALVQVGARSKEATAQLKAETQKLMEKRHGERPTP